MKMKTWVAVALLGAATLANGVQAAESIPVKDFVRHAEYSEAKISPDGTYLALTALQGEITVLAVVRLKDMVVVRTTRLSEQKSIGDFYWVGPKRLMFTATRNIGSYAQPFGTGEWFASDFDGGRARTLVSYVPQPLQVRNKLVHYTESYQMLDPLPNDETRVLMAVHDSSSEERTQVVSLDTVTGRRQVVARAPRGGQCEMVLDASHQPRYANCFDTKGEDGTYAEHSELYRRDDKDQWTLVNGSAKHKQAVNVVGTAGDGRIYALSRTDGKTAAFGELDPANNEFKLLYQDPAADPASFIMASDGNTILGVISMAGAPHVELVEGKSRDVAVYAALSKAFPDKLVDFSSATLDGREIVVSVRSDSDPGQLYLYDRESGSVRFLMRNRSWLDPAKMATIRPFSFKARDGVTLHGYLTLPGGNDRHLPVIVNPHGGPIGPRDDWGFNWETQLFASRGYLVVQLNFRGSGGYGQAFQDMGHRQWGAKMQDDLTDATRWVIDQGYADPNRICIYGGSYGGYASLMGVATQPDLYRCAVGYVGVYDLEMMYHKGDISERASGKRYLERTLGHDKLELQRRSPTQLAAQIKAPVFLAAGGRDERAPKEHTEEMRDALQAAGHPPEVVIVEAKEMHGFYDETANLNLYTKMLAFFDKYIGVGAGAQAATAGGH
jgi:dipeptidyl aminopeptidase/acylaminoacyl peptidase